MKLSLHVVLSFERWKKSSILPYPYSDGYHRIKSWENESYAPPLVDVPVAHMVECHMHMQHQS